MSPALFPWANMLVVDLLLPGWLDMEEVDILTTRDLTRPYTVQVTTNYNLTHGSHILLPSLIPGQYSYSAHGPRYIQLLAQLRPSRNLLAGIYTPEYIRHWYIYIYYYSIDKSKYNILYNEFLNIFIPYRNIRFRFK